MSALVLALGICVHGTLSGADAGELQWKIGIGETGSKVKHVVENPVFAGKTAGVVRWKVDLGGGESSLAEAGDVLGRIDIGSFGPADAVPAMNSSGMIFVGNYGNNHLHAVYPDGSQAWAFQVEGRLSTSPVISMDGTIYIGCSSYSTFTFTGTTILRKIITADYLYAIASDGTELWKFKIGGEIWSCPAYDREGTLYFGSNDGNFYAVSSDGELKWKYQTGGGISSSPALEADGSLYFGSTDGFIYALNSDGTLNPDYS